MSARRLAPVEATQSTASTWAVPHHPTRNMTWAQLDLAVAQHVLLNIALLCGAAQAQGLQAQTPLWSGGMTLGRRPGWPSKV